MRHKSLLIATLVLGLIALAAVRIGRETPPTAEARQPLFAAGLVASAQSLVIRANDKDVTLVSTPTGWVVKEKFGLPVDVENRLQPLLRDLQKAQDLGPLTANPKRLAKLGLADTALTLTGPDGRPETIHFGKQTEDGLGASMRRAGQTAARRTDFSGQLEGDPSNWADLTPFSAKSTEIKEVAFEWSDGRAAFVRKELGASFEGPQGPLVEDILNTIATIRAADAVAPDDKVAAQAVRLAGVKLTLFTGAVVTLSFSQAATPPGGGAPPRAFVRVAHSDPAHKANAMAKQAVLVAAPWMLEQLPASLADFRKGPASGAEAPSLTPIPGPAPIIVAPTEIKVK